MISIAVIDDHPLFREGVIHSLMEVGGFEIVGEGGTRDDALKIAQETHPDIVLLDVSMPGGGLSAIGPILRHRPEQKIVMLTVSESSDDISSALSSGARGYVLKGVGSRALAEILATVAAGGKYVSPDLSARLLTDLATPDKQNQPDTLSMLTERELEVLTFVAAGMSNKLVALKLGLHEKTIKHHMTRILAKLGVKNRTEAAMALRDAAEGRHVQHA